MNRTKTVPIAPSHPLSSADRAAQRAASHVRPSAKVAPLGPAAGEALGRLETWAAYVLADRQAADSARAEIAGVA